MMANALTTHGVITAIAANDTARGPAISEPEKTAVASNSQARRQAATASGVGDVPSEIPSATAHAA